MIGMDCVNQQARERDCKLTKRSQAERLAIADSLIASVWEEYLNGSIDRGTIQVAAYIQANANRIVWKLNELNNSNTPNTLKALDCISRQDAVDIINGYAEQFNGYIGTPNDSEVYAYARGLLLGIERNISALPSVQSEIEERMSETEQNVPNDDFISRKRAIDALMEDFKRIPTNAIRATTVFTVPTARDWRAEVMCMSTSIAAAGSSQKENGSQTLTNGTTASTR